MGAEREPPGGLLGHLFPGLRGLRGILGGLVEQGTGPLDGRGGLGQGVLGTVGGVSEGVDNPLMHAGTP